MPVLCSLALVSGVFAPSPPPPLSGFDLEVDVTRAGFDVTPSFSSSTAKLRGGGGIQTQRGLQERKARDSWRIHCATRAFPPSEASRHAEGSALS